MTLQVMPVTGLPEIVAGDDLAAVIAAAWAGSGERFVDGDVLVVSSKLVSKALGLRAPAATKAAAVLGQSRRVVAERVTPGGVTRIVESVAGPVLAAAGIDASNTGDANTSAPDTSAPDTSDSNPGDEPTILLLPADPDAEARRLRAALLPAAERGETTPPTGPAMPTLPTGPSLPTLPTMPAMPTLPTGDDGTAGTRAGAPPRFGVVVSDTAGRPWRHGQVDFALGAAGIPVLDDLRGQADDDGRTMSVTARAVADEIASAADLVKGKTTRVGAVVLRGLTWPHPRTPRRDLGGVGAGDDGAAGGTNRVGDPSRAGDDGATVGRAGDDQALPGEGSCDDTLAGAAALVRTGAGDWFALGHVEAVRRALGAPPGTPEAADVGIPALGIEDLEVRAERAVRLATLPGSLPGLPPGHWRAHTVTTHVDPATVEVTVRQTGILLSAADDFVLGVVTARLLAALAAEDVPAVLATRGVRANRPAAFVAFA